MNNAQKQTNAEFTRKVAELVSEGKHSSLGKLWAKLDGRARAEIIDYVGYYVGRNLEKHDAAVEDRRRRAECIRKAVSKQIAALRKAHTARAAFEETECAPFGKVVAFGDPFWPKECGPLSTILSTELLRLNKLLGMTTNLFNQKRLGLAGKYYWLVLAQEVVYDWTGRHLEQPLDLTSGHLADLIDAARIAMGQEEGEPTSPENLYKALVHFQKNPSNKMFRDLARQKLQK